MSQMRYEYENERFMEIIVIKCRAAYNKNAHKMGHFFLMHLNLFMHDARFLLKMLMLI